MNGCEETSAVAKFQTMSLRSGFASCMYHINKDDVLNKVETARRNTRKRTVIFYDVELSRDGEIEQIAAFTTMGTSFTAFMRTPTRTNTSPVLRAIPPMIYNALAASPMDVYRRFIAWARIHHNIETGGDDDSEIILAAHYGACHDHAHLLRSMMSWGLTPPKFMLADTLLLFKLTKGMDQQASLSTLLLTYAPWLQHTPHDAISDARVLRAVVSQVFPDTVLACLAFAVTYEDFIASVGLNLYISSPMSPFPARTRSGVVEEYDDDGGNGDDARSTTSADTI